MDEVVMAARAVQELSQPAAQFTATVAGTGPVSELSAWLGDLVRGGRFRAQLKVLTRAYEAVERAGLPPQVVPRKILAPLLETAGLEDPRDEPMIERWSHLLANAAVDSEQHVVVAFPAILGQLDAADALVLEALERLAKEAELTGHRDNRRRSRGPRHPRGRDPRNDRSGSR